MSAHALVTGLLGASLLAYVSLAAGWWRLPRGEATPAGWGPSAAIGVMCLFVSGMILAPLVGSAVSVLLGRSPKDTSAILLGLVLTYILYFVTLLVVLRSALDSGSGAASLGFDRTPLWRVVSSGFHLCLLFLPVQLLFGFAAGLLYRRIFGCEPDEQMAVRLIGQASPLVITALTLAAVILAPITEELVFRAYFQRGIERKYGTTAGIVVTALLFPVIHGGLATMIGLIPISFLLSIVYARRRNILVNMVFHAAFNASMIAIALSARFGGLDLSCLTK